MVHEDRPKRGTMFVPVRPALALLFLVLFVLLVLINQLVDDRIIGFVLLSQLNKPVPGGSVDPDGRLGHVNNGIFVSHMYVIAYMKHNIYAQCMHSIHCPKMG